MQERARKPLPIRYRFAALTAGLLCAGIIAFGAAAYLEVRRSALGLAGERLISVTDQLGQRLEASAANQRAALGRAAQDSVVQEFLREPTRALNVERLAALSTITGPSRANLTTQLFDTGGRFLHASNSKVAVPIRDAVRQLTELVEDTGSTATGWLARDRDSLIYPIIARSRAGDSVLGYVVQWRRLASSERDRDQLSGLIGSSAVLHLGNARGDLWTDLEREIAAPPLPLSALSSVLQYEHGAEGGRLAYARRLTNTPWTLAVEFDLPSVLAPATRTVRRLVLVAVVLLLVSALSAWLTARSLTKPIAELAVATQEIRAGNYSRRVSAGRRDELGTLAEHFNEMAAAIAGGKHQVEQQLEQLKTLRTIDLAILGTTDLQVALKTVVLETRERLQVDVAMAMLFMPQTYTIEMAASAGTRTTALPQLRVRLGEGVTGRAALERRTIGYPDLTREAPNDLHPVARTEGLRALYAVPLIAKGQLVGVLAIGHREALQPNHSWLTFLEALAGQAAMAIDSGKSFEALQRSHMELALAYDTTIEGWSRALDLRDKETEGHTQRVADMTLRLARLAGMNDTELIHVKRGALLHDIGKMGVPDSILLKPGKLTDEEWALMRMHPTFAYELLSPVPYLRPALDIPYAHHEKWDGSGYPRGLKGQEIPWAARLFAVIDVWDALRSDRPYRPGWPEHKVQEYLREQSRIHFDPDALAIFQRLAAEFAAEAEPIESLSPL
ncbi:MAG TPA: HD domain-containing phosphohydrolase [Gemmatimonadaceae bacterium]|nr:HD domain-containing phosphohydrolase [Gemmatimonadaceae bacterium]